MKEMTFEIGGKTIKRVRRDVAKKHFEAGDVIYVYQCLANPNSPWNQPAIFNKGRGEESFEQRDNSFRYYNHYSELGRYPAYYVEV